MIIKLFSCLGFIVALVFTPELFSTMLRGVGCSFTNFMCRSGGAIMPWILAYTYRFGNLGPFLAISSITIISCIATFMLPMDTTGRRLDTYEKVPETDSDDLNNNKNSN